MIRCRVRRAGPGHDGRASRRCKEERASSCGAPVSRSCPARRETWPGRGSWRTRASTMAATVGASKSTRMGSSRRKTSCIRDMTRVASRECPPSSKKSSSTPTRARPRRRPRPRRRTSSRRCAGGDEGDAARGIAPRLRGGAGRLLRSTLPLRVEGEGVQDAPRHRGPCTRAGARCRNARSPATGRSPPVTGDDVRHQRGGPTLLDAHDRGFAHGGVRCQHGLDLARLDAEAADLHLLVDPAQELERCPSGAGDSAPGRRCGRAAAGLGPKGSGTKRSAVRSGRLT